ncbi:unnamed protein product [Amoebophrya sp. A120]|nr:unnamed protein product [Amoebophrya sp. A120]|eukprot:GSA120T00006303001.1
MVKCYRRSWCLVSMGFYGLFTQEQGSLVAASTRGVGSRRKRRGVHEPAALLSRVYSLGDVAGVDGTRDPDLAGDRADDDSSDAVTSDSDDDGGVRSGKVASVARTFSAPPPSTQDEHQEVAAEIVPRRGKANNFVRSVSCNAFDSVPDRKALAGGGSGTPVWLLSDPNKLLHNSTRPLKKSQSFTLGEGGKPLVCKQLDVDPKNEDSEEMKNYLKAAALNLNGTATLDAFDTCHETLKKLSGDSNAAEPVEALKAKMGVPLKGVLVDCTTGEDAGSSTVEANKGIAELGKKPNSGSRDFLKTNSAKQFGGSASAAQQQEGGSRRHSAARPALCNCLQQIQQPWNCLLPGGRTNRVRKVASRRAGTAVPVYNTRPGDPRPPALLSPRSQVSEWSCSPPPSPSRQESGYQSSFDGVDEQQEVEFSDNLSVTGLQRTVKEGERKGRQVRVFALLEYLQGGSVASALAKNALALQQATTNEALEANLRARQDQVLDLVADNLVETLLVRQRAAVRFGTTAEQRSAYLNSDFVVGKVRDRFRGLSSAGELVSVSAQPAKIGSVLSPQSRAANPKPSPWSALFDTILSQLEKDAARGKNQKDSLSFHRPSTREEHIKAEAVTILGPIRRDIEKARKLMEWIVNTFGEVLLYPEFVAPAAHSDANLGNLLLDGVVDGRSGNKRRIWWNDNSATGEKRVPLEFELAKAEFGCLHTILLLYAGTSSGSAASGEQKEQLFEYIKTKSGGPPQMDLGGNDDIRAAINSRFAAPSPLLPARWSPPTALPLRGRRAFNPQSPPTPELSSPYSRSTSGSSEADGGSDDSPAVYEGEKAVVQPVDKVGHHGKPRQMRRQVLPMSAGTASPSDHDTAAMVPRRPHALARSPASLPRKVSLPPTLEDDNADIPPLSLVGMDGDDETARREHQRTRDSRCGNQFGSAQTGYHASEDSAATSGAFSMLPSYDNSAILKRSLPSTVSMASTGIPKTGSVQSISSLSDVDHHHSLLDHRPDHSSWHVIQTLVNDTTALHHFDDADEFFFPSATPGAFVQDQLQQLAEWEVPKLTRLSGKAAALAPFAEHWREEIERKILAKYNTEQPKATNTKTRDSHDMRVPLLLLRGRVAAMFQRLSDIGYAIQKQPPNLLTRLVLNLQFMHLEAPMVLRMLHEFAALHHAERERHAAAQIP